jgi:hypothetical protein
VGPRLFFSFLMYSIHNRQGSLNEWSAQRKASTETLNGKWPIILLRGPLESWGSLTCTKCTTRVKQLKVPPGGICSLNSSVLKNSTTSPGLNPRRWSHDVGTLPLDYGPRLWMRCLIRYVPNVLKPYFRGYVQTIVEQFCFVHPCGIGQKVRHIKKEERETKNKDRSKSW